MEYSCNALNINVFSQLFKILYHFHIWESPKDSHTNKKMI